MLKRIALTTVIVVSVAFAGVGAAKAHVGTKAPTIDVAPPAPRGLCFPLGSRC
jgi:hypothetical protein